MIKTNREQFALIDSSQLAISVKVHLVEHLKNGVEQSGERRIAGLFDNLRHN